MEKEIPKKDPKLEKKEPTKSEEKKDKKKKSESKKKSDEDSSSDSHESEEEEEKEETFESSSALLDKYKAAALITQDTLKYVISLCTAGSDIADICIKGDQKIDELVGKIYNSKKGKVTEKGIAFPTCISVNEICGHYSPLKEESSKLVEGDVAKIDLGCHIDGYIAQLAHTFIVGNPKKVSGKKAEIILAAKACHDAAIRLVKAGNTNTMVTKMIGKIAALYKVNPLEGVLSHKVKKHMIDGDDVIINKEAHDQKVEEHKFDKNEVYVIDVILSTGEGKPKETDKRTTVFKRALETAYSLKLKHSRLFFHQVGEKHPTLPFSINAFPDATAARVGVAECINHDLLQQYPVLAEKTGEIVAQFKSTIALLPTGPMLLNSMNLEPEAYESATKIEDKEIVELLTSQVGKKKKVKKEGKKDEAKAPTAEIKKEEKKV